MNIRLIKFSRPNSLDGIDAEFQIKIDHRTALYVIEDEKLANRIVELLEKYGMK